MDHLSRTTHIYSSWGPADDAHTLRNAELGVSFLEKKVKECHSTWSPLVRNTRNDAPAIPSKLATSKLVSKATPPSQNAELTTRARPVAPLKPAAPLKIGKVAPKDATSNGNLPPSPAPTPSPVQVIIKQATVSPSKGAPGNSNNVPTPCQDLTGVYGCHNASAVVMRGPWLANGQSQRIRAPGQQHALTPDVESQILALADVIENMAEDDPTRAPAILDLRRKLADNNVGVEPYDLLCLEPTTGKDRQIAEIPLNWRKEDINVEGMKAAHLCQDVMNQEDLDSCHKANYGRVVMYVEPELAGQCRSAGGPTHDIDKMAECAKNKFDNGWT